MFGLFREFLQCLCQTTAVLGDCLGTVITGGCHLIAIFFNCLHFEFIDSLVHFRHPHYRWLFALIALRSCNFHLSEVQSHDIGVWVCLFVA